MCASYTEYLKTYLKNSASDGLSALCIRFLSFLKYERLEKCIVAFSKNFTVFFKGKQFFFSEIAMVMINW